MQIFIRSKAGRTAAADCLILPLGRIIADHAADEGVSPITVASSLVKEKFNGYILMRDLARTRQGVILMVAGYEAGTILQVGRDILTGTEAAKRIMADHPALALAITAHDLGEPQALVASATLTGAHFFQRMPTAALNLPILLDIWKKRRITGLLWVGGSGQGLATYFYQGGVLGEIKQGESKLRPGTVGLCAMWKEENLETEAFMR